MSISRVIILFLLLPLFQSCLPGRFSAPFKRFGRKTPSQAVIPLDEVSIKPKRQDDFRTTPTRTMDLLHTSLAVSFNWGKHECIGKAVIRMKPYFYQTDSIVLDARYMNFGEITVADQQGEHLLFLMSYNKKQLKLKLEKPITRTDTITVTIRYTARPDEVLEETGMSASGDKGLYFINTDHAEPFKPVQLWTQGEPESNANWFPTIDQPQEKFTMQLAITVNKEMTTLSNGKLLSSVTEGNLRTDTWSNTKPMPAYLVMMAVGDFVRSTDSLTAPGVDSFMTVSYDTIHLPARDTSEVERDSIVEKQTMKVRQVDRDLLNGVEVSYYLEPAYAPYAKAIFARTPEMIAFFGQRLGVPYPWEKYAQVVVRDYVSGAMENTSATLHGEPVQKTLRELLDSENDDIISHELFHQWFGDLVTCRSWSQLVLNEGFASYGEQLWVENKKGADAALLKRNRSLESYLRYAKAVGDGPVIDYNYKEPDDMFSTITYQKGALVLHLLRSELGDEAFFASLQRYLELYRFDNADLDEFRQVCESISGKDLRPFFTQWFLHGGHPVIDIHYDYNDTTRLYGVRVEQKQSQDGQWFRFPLQFTVRQGGVEKTYQFDISRRIETFYVQKFDPSNPEPPLILVDPKGTFIGELTDHKSTISPITAYSQAKGSLLRLRALKALKEQQQQMDTVRQVMLKALADPEPEIRERALEWIDWSNAISRAASRSMLMAMCQADPEMKVRARAVSVLSDWKENALLPLFRTLVLDSSYSIAGAALMAVYKMNPSEAVLLAKNLETDSRKALLNAISTIYAKAGDEAQLAFFEQHMMRVYRRERVGLMSDYTDLALRLDQANVYQRVIGQMENRAKSDQDALVRINAISSLLAIHDKQLELNALEKDPLKKADKTRLLAAFKEQIQQLVDQEKQRDAIQMMKVKGILQTQEVNEDR